MARERHLAGATPGLKRVALIDIPVAVRVPRQARCRTGVAPVVSSRLLRGGVVGSMRRVGDALAALRGLSAVRGGGRS